MKMIQESELPWIEGGSPKGRFHVFCRTISEALGAPRHAGVAGGGHPFEVTLARIPVDAVNYPFHSHAAQWELYLVLSGTGEVRGPEEVKNIGPGDAFIFPPGEAHQLRNTGTEDLVYYVIADNPPADIVHYPDSNKWLVRPPRQIFTMTPAEYYDGEE